jgi:hypothetical protein
MSDMGITPTGDERHQSCVLLTSREKPIGWTAKEGKALPVRSLQLNGLGQKQRKSSKLKV